MPFLSGKIPPQKYPYTFNFDLLFLKAVIIFTWRYLSLLSFLSEPCWRWYYSLEITPIRHSTKNTSVTSMKKFSTAHMTEHMRLQLTPSSPHLTKYHAPPQHCHPKGFNRWWKWYGGTPSEAGCKCQRGSELTERSVHTGSEHTEGCSERICPRVLFKKCVLKSAAFPSEWVKMETTPPTL